MQKPSHHAYTFMGGMDMKHFKRICIMLLAVFIFLGAMNFSSVDRVWAEWLKGEAQSYYGNINLWHINDEFGLKIPYSSMLKKYEKQNFGIFINVSYLTAGEAREKIGNGEYPDIVVYSVNFFDNPQKELESLEKIDSPFLKAGSIGNEIKAYPMFYDTYSLIINEELIDELEEEIPSMVEPDYILKRLVNLKYKEGILPLGFSSWGAMANMFMAAGSSDYEVSYHKTTLKDFAGGAVAVMMCSTLELEKYNGEMPAYSSFEFGGFTDRVRYISVYKGSGDKNRINCSKEIAGLLMSEKYQKQINDYAFTTAMFNGNAISDKQITMAGLFKNRLTEEEVKNRFDSERSKLMDEIYKMSE